MNANIVRIVDRLQECINDNNSKVAISAINHLRTTVQQPSIKPKLNKLLPIFVESLCNNLAAGNAAIRRNCDEAINEIMVIAPVHEFITHLAHAITFNNARVKAFALPKLTDAVFKMKVNTSTSNNSNERERAQQTLEKCVMPAVVSAVDSRGSTQVDCRKLLRLVYSMIGKRMFAVKAVKKLRREQISKIEAMVNR